MNKIPDLKVDFDFLEKINFQNKAWMERTASKKPKREVSANFLLHPKRLNSDSEYSSPSSPKNFLSTTTIFKKTHLIEHNNNGMNNLSSHADFGQNTEMIHIVGSDTGNSKENAKAMLLKPKSVNCCKKIQKCRPSSMRVENFDKKFKNFVEKSVKLLTDIRLMLEKGISSPDGEEDTTRRTKRLQEFSSRFSRTYLYPLLRQMDELSIPERLGITEINQKLTYAQQIIVQGLQAYYNHLPSSVGKCCSDKLQSLLDQVLYLCQLFGLLKKESVDDGDEFINALRSHTELLSENIKTLDLKLNEKSQKAQEITKKKSKTFKAKSKLSMYAVSASFRKDLEWKKAVESLAKKKFDVKSRYRTANFKHRPPVEKPHIVSLPSKVKLFPKRTSSGLLKETPKKSPIREDDIKTMVELEGDLEAPPNTGKILNHENGELQQLVRDRNLVGDDNGVKKALEVLKKFLLEHEGVEGGEEVLEKIETEMTKRRVREDNEDKAKQKYKKPVITITGARNAKLICIRDDNSIVENDEEDIKIDKEVMTEAEIKLTSSETQTEFKEAETQVKNKSIIKISRLPKTNRKILQLLPKDYAINIIQYKLRYNHFHKHNPMYRKSANIQPWVLMGRVSDNLLDDILHSVSTELEVNEMIESLYNAEFQY